MADASRTEPKVFDHYTVESILGHGAMGTVYLARDTRIGRRVALKTVRAADGSADPKMVAEFYKRLQREAELSGSIQHPNIVTLYEVGYDGDRISYLATEFVDGPSLKAVLQNGKLPVARAFAIAEDLLKGLSFAHEKKIVHRDLKPGNVLLSLRGGAKIADFGIARPERSDLTTSGAMIGTPNYMSPEQVQALPVTPQSDLFSVGVILYEMISGQRPFQAPNTSTVLYNIVHEDPKPVQQLEPSISPEEARFVHRLLAKKPKDRFTSAEEALRELMDITSRSTRAAAVAPPIAPPKARPFLRRRIPNGLFYGVAGALLLLLAAAAGRALTEIRRAPQVRIPSYRVAEFQQKKTMLANARLLQETGRTEESIEIYDDYLKRYPYSTAARDARDQARRELKQRIREEKRSDETAKVSQKSRRRTQSKEKPSVRKRLRDLFRRD